MDEFCIPFGVGVPFANQPPGFARGPGTDLDSHNKRLDDPRWTGASRLGYGASPDPHATAGSMEHAALRAIYHTHDGAALYFLWRLSVDPLPDEQDRLYVGFEQRSSIPAANRCLIARIRPSLAATVAFEGFAWEEDGIGPTAEIFEGDGTTFSAASVPAPGHFVHDMVRAWKVEGKGWAVALRVPIVAGGGPGGLDLDVATGFKFWFEVRNLNREEGGISLPESWRFPKTVNPADEDSVVPAARFPNVSTWADAHHGAGCAVNLSLPYSGIGTANTAPFTDAGEMALGFDPTTNVADATQPPNRFFAQLNYDGSKALGASAVTAHFYIANWGSQIGTPPLPVPGSTLGEQGEWSLVTSGGSTPVAAGASNVRIEALWTATQAEAQLFLPLDSLTSQRSSHQCIYVQVEGADLTFANDSVARNMNFVEASLFEREADISVRGLSPSPDGSTHRNVYLYVQTFNMPTEPAPGGEDGGGDIKLAQLRKLLWSRGKAGEDCGDVYASGSSGSGLPLENEFELQERYQPTYKVHVYHESDDFVREGAVLRRVIRPQTSFGFFVKHDGELYAWDHQIVGADLIAPNFWKLRVPNNGVAKITTRILAREKESDRLDHSSDSKTDCQRAVEPVLEQLAEIRKQLARCCPSAIRIQAEHFLATGGVNKGPRSHPGVEAMRGFIGHISDGDWALYGNVDFGSAQWKTVTLSYVSVFGGRHVEVYADSADGLADYRAASGRKLPDRFANATKLADIELPSSGKHWNPPFVTATTPLTAAPKDKSLIVLVFRKGKHPDPLGIAFVDWLQFQT